MPTKLMVTTALVGLCAAPSLYMPEVANARPSASQVRNWLGAGATAIGIIGKIYKERNTYLGQQEVRRNFYEQNGAILFSYTANCAERGNVNRFWRHAENEKVTDIIRSAFPGDPETQKQAVLLLISNACSPS